MAQRTLKIPREEARALYQQQIAKGESLLARQIHTEEELARYVEDRERYNRVNRQMLERIFGEEEIDLFWRFGISSPPEYGDFDSKVRFYKEWDAKQVNELRGLEESLNLVPDAPMDPQKLKLLEAKLAALKTFVDNVTVMGSRMDDDRTRDAYRAIYRDIQKLLGDEDLKTHAPNIQEGRVIGNTTGKLWASHQIEIIDSGTRLISYVEAKLLTKEESMGSAPQSKTWKQLLEENLMAYTISIVIISASVTFGIMKWYYGDYITNRYEAKITGITNERDATIRDLQAKIRQLESTPPVQVESKPVDIPKTNP